MIYIRNLMLIRKRKFAYTAAAPSQKPREDRLVILSEEAKDPAESP